MPLNVVSPVSVQPVSEPPLASNPPLVSRLAFAVPAIASARPTAAATPLARRTSFIVPFSSVRSVAPILFPLQVGESKDECREAISMRKNCPLVKQGVRSVLRASGSQRPTRCKFFRRCFALQQPCCSASSVVSRIGRIGGISEHLLERRTDRWRQVDSGRRVHGLEPLLVGRLHAAAPEEARHGVEHQRAKSRVAARENEA